jgi:hypothetical protein
MHSQHRSLMASRPSISRRCLACASKTCRRSRLTCSGMRRPKPWSLVVRSNDKLRSRRNIFSHLFSADPSEELPCDCRRGCQGGRTLAVNRAEPRLSGPQNPRHALLADLLALRLCRPRWPSATFPTLAGERRRDKRPRLAAPEAGHCLGAELVVGGGERVKRHP